MRLLRILGTFLNRFAGFALGITFIPLVNLGQLYVLLSMIIALGLIFPVLSSVSVMISLLRMSKNIWQTVALIAASVVIVPLVAASALMISIAGVCVLSGMVLLSAPFIILESALRGARKGLFYGLSGFMDALLLNYPERFQYYLSNKFFAFFGFGRFHSEEQVDIDLESPVFPGRAPQNHLDQLEVEEPDSQPLLSADSLQQLSVYLKRKKEDPHFELLRTQFKRYKELSSLITSITEKEMPDDQIFLYLDVEKPVLFYKEYREGEIWRVVPVTTRLTDLDNWKQHQQNKSMFGLVKHPLFGDRISAPDKWNGHETRYRWHQTIKGTCKELQELSMELEQALDNLNDEPEKSQTFLLSQNKYSFHTSAANPPDAQEEDIHSYLKPTR